MGAVKVLQVVGFKNSGKTSLLSFFLDEAAKNGKAVSTIKHHGHGGEPDMPPASTDSMRFFHEGAVSSLVYGGGVIGLHSRQKEASLEQLIALSMQAKPDLILVEGFKEADFEKVVLVRSDDEWQQLNHLKRIRLVIAPKELPIVGVRTVERNSQQFLKNWFSEWMEGDEDESI
ncbi:molybdopterin-guanine dinucleotide biosynthesis protein B [Planococcus sp. YIM B11945]|uniref:molybdopterin-guanine dinucleotide biosynthesis protein B n=1 Tax=Planococcus sp. YIM B11945 TaxID=3435410 RepID=UPI003D7C4BC6